MIHEGPDKVGQPSRESSGFETVTVPLSPFLVARLQLLSGIPQKDVVLFLGVVVLVALRDSNNSKI